MRQSEGSSRRRPLALHDFATCIAVRNNCIRAKVKFATNNNDDDDTASHKEVHLGNN